MSTLDHKIKNLTDIAVEAALGQPKCVKAEYAPKARAAVKPEKILKSHKDKYTECSGNCKSDHAMHKALAKFHERMCAKCTKKGDKSVAACHKACADAHGKMADCCK